MDKLEIKLTRLISVNKIIPDSVIPYFPSDDDNTFVEEGINHPSIRAKSRRPSRWNKRDAPSRILLIISVGKRGGV